MKDLLFEVLSAAVNGQRIDVPSNAVQLLFDEALKQSVLPMVYTTVTNPERKKYQTKLAQVTYQSVQVTEAHSKLSKLLSDNNIAFTTFKGYASSLYYLKPDFRVMGDVDFYVAPEDFERANELLLQNGWTLETKFGHHEWSYWNGKIHYEMHFAFSGVPRGDEGTKLQKLLDNVIETSREVGEKKIRIVDDFHHGVIILIHTASHLYSNGIGLRHLCDWAVFVNSMKPGEFEKLFEVPFKEVGLWQFAKILTKVCEEKLGIRKQDWTTDVDPSTVEALANELFDKGNFGRKVQDDNSGLMVSDGFSSKVGEDSNIKQFLSSLSVITEKHWPISKKVKILLPIGWVFFSCRYAVRVLMGKRKMLNFGKMSEEATKRKKLYKQLGILCVEADE